MILRADKNRPSHHTIRLQRPLPQIVLRQFFFFLFKLTGTPQILPFSPTRPSPVLGGGAGWGPCPRGRGGRRASPPRRARRPRHAARGSRAPGRGARRAATAAAARRRARPPPGAPPAPRPA